MRQFSLRAVKMVCVPPASLPQTGTVVSQSEPAICLGSQTMQTSPLQVRSMHTGTINGVKASINIRCFAIRECGSTPYVGMTHPLNTNNDRLTSLFPYGGPHSVLYMKPRVKHRALTRSQLRHSLLNTKTEIAKNRSFIWLFHHHNNNLLSSDGITQVWS